LPEVLVTASRYDQQLQSAPNAAQVISAEEIMASGASDANDAIRKILGLANRSDLNGGHNNTLDLGGYGSTADQNVVVVVDGLRISENESIPARLSAIAPETIASIEVLRGGSSVQWGEGATAGVINIVLKRNTAAGVSGSGLVQLESYNGSQARADLHVGADWGSLDANARSLNSDGYRDNSAYHQDTAALAYNTEKGALRLHAELRSENEDSRLPGSLTWSQFAANPRQSLTPGDWGQFSETRVNTGAAYQSGDWTYNLDLGGRNKDAQGYYASTSYGFNNSSQSYQLSPKLRYNGALGANALSLVGGVDVQDWNFHGSNTGPGEESARQTNQAGYLGADLLLPSGLRIVAGARSEEVVKSSDDPLNSIHYTRPNALSAWDLGLSQALLGGYHVYARSATSYRVANVDDNRYLSTALQPQTALDSELGLKWQGASGSSAGLRVFQQDVVNEIAYDPVAQANVNLDPTQRVGAEINSGLQLRPGVRLNTALQTIQAHFSGGVNSGREIPLVSNISGAVRLNWAVDAHQTVDAGVQYLGSARLGNDTDNSCSARIPESTKLDARYTWKEKSLEWTVAGNNLTDVNTYSYAYSCSTGAIYPDARRTLSLSLKYSL